tara:strand:- start:8797 stop:9795 length:999 start_codon:yes stop_codon:yes gene_type:complete
VILITGCAGFIGSNLVIDFIRKGIKVVGIDLFNSSKISSFNFIKKYRLDHINNLKNSKDLFTYIVVDILDKNSLDILFKKYNFRKVIHLAAFTGVRASSKEPHICVSNNIAGFHNIIELCSQHNIIHFIYASSSSIYNKNNSIMESDDTNSPLSIYAATKKSNELLAYSYSHNFNLKTTGLRFFSVYGAFGRPDMSYFKFINSIFNDKSVNLSNYGNNKRDFTYIDDVINAIWQVFNNEGKNKFSVYNIGAEKPISIKNLIDVIEKILNKKLKIKHTRRFTEDAQNTKSNSRLIKSDYNISFKTNISIGIKNFIKWYRKYKIEYDKFCTNTN